MVALQSREALDAALSTYRIAFSSTFTSDTVVLDEDDMTTLIGRVESEALNVLREKAVGDVAEIRKLEAEMKKQVRTCWIMSSTCVMCHVSCVMCCIMLYICCYLLGCTYYC